MTSTRLPGKVLAQAEGRPMLDLLVERLRQVPELNEIVIATTTNESDDPVAALAQKLGVGIWRGSEDDVLQRVLDAATNYKADVIVELTGDCPLMDPAIVSRVVGSYREGGVDYVSNILSRTYPIGMDVQVFSRDVLARVAATTANAEDHEHVSLFIYRNPQLFTLRNVAAPPEQHRPELRLTLDTPEDLSVIRALFAALHPGGSGFSLDQMLAWLDANPEVASLNSQVRHRHV